MKKLKLFAGMALILLVIAFIAKNPLLQGVADFLIVDENAAKSDVIIVLGGELKGERTKKAVELYNKGYGERLLFSEGTDLSWRTKAIDEMVALALQLDVPKEDIEKETDSRSTYENALYSRDIMLKNNWSSAIVVTTDWHTKRSRFVFDKVFRDTNIRLTYSGAPDERIDSLEKWWKDGEKQQIVLTEWAKLVIYWLKY